VTERTSRLSLYGSPKWVCPLAALLTLGLSCSAKAQPNDPASQPGYFTKNLYPILEKANCRGCHNVDGVAAATRIHFPEPNASPQAIEAFGLSLVAVVDHEHPEKSLLRNKPTLRIPHTGGKRIPPGTKEEAVLLTWVAHLEHLSASETAAALHGISAGDDASAVKAVPVMHRLTHSQYNHTVHDLLGEESNPADQFPPEDFVNGFKGQYQTQDIGPLLADAYSAAAEKLARAAFRGGDTHGLIPCKPTSPADAACRAKFIRSFGLKAFRQPLTDGESQRYETLFSREAFAQHDFVKGAQIVVEAMLQSPQFLFRVENGADARCRPYEAASKLSYFLWDSMPDAALFRSAANGELSTPTGFERVARRMLADPRAHRSVDEYVSEWLRLDRVLSAVKDRRAYPQFTPELAQAMAEETRRLIADAVWNNRNFLDIFTADYSFVNADLANVYGVPAPSEEFGKVSFPANSGRAGITGQAAFLSLTSKPGETSPTARGLFVREQLLCQHIPDPPPGVNTNLPALSEDRPMTNRERMALHRNNESCATCHNLIDPIGFGLEKYDGIGRYRDKLKLQILSMAHDKLDKKPRTFELPLDTSGTIAGIPDSSFSSPKGLGRLLAESAQCQQCIAKQLFRYEEGRMESFTDRPVLERIVSDFRNSGYHFQDLMVSVIKWTQFPPGKADDVRRQTN
jgi:hypothetical protein